MKSQDALYPKVRITKKAHKHLAKLVPILRENSGLNISMTDLVSEWILAQPIPSTGRKPVKKSLPVVNGHQPMVVAE